jgi:protein-S-isoprenylcysteine O-methyltransferase Ste14
VVPTSDVAGGGAPSRGPLVPPVYFALAFLLMVVLNHLLPLVRFELPALDYLGALLLLAGIALDVWAVILFRRARTGIRPFQPAAALVVDGPYRFTRNPMYLGMVLILVGLALRLGSLSPWLAPPLFVALIQQRFIRAEEAFMQDTFGADYARYRAGVRRWL